MRGYTLIDVVAALAIAGLLAAIAMPSYRSEVVRAGRADARAALLNLATSQEKFFIECHRYAATLADSSASSCALARLQFPTSVGQGSYRLTVLAADANGWAATATVVPGGPQAADTRCNVLELTATGVMTATAVDGSASDHECWRR